MIEEKTIYVCSECQKIYEYRVVSCPDCENAIREGKMYGPFKIISKLVTNREKYKVECVPCGYETTIARTNLKRQKSCGCKPRHIDIRSVDENSIRYFCHRCRQIKITQPPIFEWCCTEEED